MSKTKKGDHMFKKLLFYAILLSGFNSQAELIIMAEGMDNNLDLIQDFERATGEKVKLISAAFKDNYDALSNLRSYSEVQVFKAEAPDLFITKDITYLAKLKSEGFTQAFDDLTVFKSIKAGMMDTKDRHFVGLTYRARTLVYHKDADVSEINSYEDLAQTDFEDQLCLRTSNSSYNTALVSFLITEYDTPLAKTKISAEDILLGWLNNLTQPVHKGDTQILTDIHTGLCSLGLANHYYLAREFEKAEAEGRSFDVRIKFLNQDAEHTGTHVNGYGAALMSTSSGDRRSLAHKFVEMLLSEKAQVQLSTQQHAYPVLEGLEPQSLIQTWDKFKPSDLSWSELAEKIPAAELLIKSTNYN